MTHPRQSQAARSQATRDAIVDAALVAFADRGYAAASMDDVRLAAGVSKGGLYHHFASKSAVLAAVVERLAQTQTLLTPPRTPNQTLSAEDASTGRLLIEVWSKAMSDADLRTQLQAAYEACFQAQPYVAPPGAELISIGALVQLLLRIEAQRAAAVPETPRMERAA